MALLFPGYAVDRTGYICLLKKNLTAILSHRIAVASHPTWRFHRQFHRRPEDINDPRPNQFPDRESISCLVE